MPTGPSKPARPSARPSSFPPALDRRQPGRDRIGAEVHLQPDRLDGLDRPPIREAGPDLLLGDAAGTEAGWEPVAEAQHVDPGTGGGRGPQAVDVAGAIFVAEDVEPAAV